MPVIGTTGGICSGKSTVARLLVEKLASYGAENVERFSADECSHELTDSHSGVREQIRGHFGPDVFLENGELDRPGLRRIIFANPKQRQILETILHPRIHETWLKKAKDFRSPTCYLVAEIPLLYETKSESHFDSILVVETNAQVQLERLATKRGWSAETARLAIEAQMPASEKMRLANIIILNQYTEELLQKQVDLAARTLLSQYV